MKIIKKDLKKGMIILKAETAEDLWHLSHIIMPEDSVKGSTERKIKLNSGEERNQRVIRKKITLTIRVEKVSYENNRLRLLGIITEGPDEIPRGEHHSIVMEEGDEIKIIKQEWPEWQLEKIREATEEKKEKILAVLFDRETAYFVLLTSKGYELLTRIKGEVQKKDVEEKNKSNFWKEINKQLKEYDERYKVKTIIAASPAFWKEYLKKNLEEELEKKTIYASISDANEKAINELLKRPELKTALEKDRSTKEEKEVEELLKAIANEKAAYGLKEVEEKTMEGSLKKILISQKFMEEEREKGNYKRIDEILRTGEKTKAKIIIITTDEAEKTIQGLGGIAGEKRW